MIPSLLIITFIIMMPSFHFRRFFFILSLLTVTPSWSQSSFSGLSFSHKDWSLDCDNTGTCRAAGYHLEQEPKPASLLISRDAGPHSSVQMSVQFILDGLDFIPQGPYTLWANSLSIPVPHPDLTQFSANDSQRLLGVLLDAKKPLKFIQIQDARHHTWSISLSGMHAALLKMDEFQGRLRTSGALISKGSLDESLVPSAFRPEPVRVLPLPLDAHVPSSLVQTIQNSFLPFLKEDFSNDRLGCFEDPKHLEAGALEVQRWTLEPQTFVVSYSCSLGAYNATTYHWWVRFPSPPTTDVTLTSDSIEPWPMEGDLDVLSGSVTSLMKGRGLGDCISTRTWHWNGHDFIPTSDISDTFCRGFPGGAWPTSTLSIPLIPEKSTIHP